MTLCASNVDPSEHAKVTSTKSCLEWRSRNVEATLTVKSFHFRLYFWVDPIAYMMDISASLIRCQKGSIFDYCDTSDSVEMYLNWNIHSIVFILGTNWNFHPLLWYRFQVVIQKYSSFIRFKIYFGCQLADDAYVIGLVFVLKIYQSSNKVLEICCCES